MLAIKVCVYMKQMQHAILSWFMRGNLPACKVKLHLSSVDLLSLVHRYQAFSSVMQWQIKLWHMLVYQDFTDQQSKCPMFCCACLCGQTVMFDQLGRCKSRDQFVDSS